MDPSRTFGRIAATIERERANLVSLGVSSASPSAAAIVDEIWTSTALAGSPLSRAEVATLVEGGVVSGGRRLEHYVRVADYAAAAGFVRSAPTVARRRPHLRSDEIVELHARATRRSGDDTPGAWRSTTLGPFPSGMVAPPAWLVPREVAAFVERLVAGPPRDTIPVLWVAAAHARFERIQPFATANGRVGRLVANLLARRVGLPPLVVPPRDAARYVAALRRADARDPWPLATLFARSALAGILRAAATHRENLGLVPLMDIAPPNERAALYKAAQRGRLLTVRRAGTLLSTQAWVDTYRASRASAKPGGA